MTMIEPVHTEGLAADDGLLAVHRPPLSRHMAAGRPPSTATDRQSGETPEGPPLVARDPSGRPLA